MFLNVREPPFDDIDVRRAVNFAVDRAKLVELYGGPQVAASTCQIVPAAFPGFTSYCPYTANPSRGGWAAPDLERARRLVAASGHAGARVTVIVGVAERSRAGPYFVSLLRDLGFHARLRVPPDYFAVISRPGSRAQMGLVPWAPDYLSASIMLDPTFGCAERGDTRLDNFSHLCDAGLDAAIRRARAAAPEDVHEAWAAVDQRVVDLAAAVPYNNERIPIYVSKRVGNVTFHPTYQVMLDQMWVR